MTSKEKMLKARTQLLFKYPFFATLILRLKMIEDDNLDPPSMATDGIRLIYHPNFVDTISIPEIMGVLVHEALHCSLNHPTRCGERNHLKWNYATDYAVNPLVLNAGFKLPKPFLYDHQFLKKPAEVIYNLLPDLPEQPILLVGNVIQPTGEDGEALTSGQVKQLEGEWAMAIESAIVNAKEQHGNFPRELVEIIELLNKPPQIPWQEEFRQFMTSPARNDYSWTRCNRRFIHQKIYLPGLHSYKMGTVVWVVDSSGSVGKEEFEAFAHEFNGVAEETQPETIHFAWCDTELHGIEELTMDDFPLDKTQPWGRGGTHFDEPFKWIQEQNIQPDCMVYLTDLYGDCTVDPPDYPVLWVCTSSEKRQSDVRFGKLIHIEA